MAQWLQILWNSQMGQKRDESVARNNDDSAAQALSGNDDLCVGANLLVC